MITRESIEKIMKDLGSPVDMPDSLVCKNPRTVIDYLGIEQEPSPRPPFNNFLGIKLIENAGLPDDKAYLLDKSGNVLQVFTIPTPTHGINRN